MKKSIKSIIMCVLALMMCFTFADTVKASTDATVYILGEKVTGDTASGNGWRFERAKDNESYHKLYLTNATLTVDDSTINADVDGQAIEIWDKLEIVLTDNNTINMNAQNVDDLYYYDAIDATDLIISGQGSLTIRAKDYGAIETESYGIYGEDSVEIKDSVKINIEGPVHTTESTYTSQSCGLCCSGNMVIGDNTEINISGLGVNSKLENECKVFIAAIGCTNELTICNNAKINISIDDSQGYDMEYSGVEARGELFVYDKAQIDIELGNVKGGYINYKGINASTMWVANNVTIDIKGNDVSADCQVDAFAIYVDELVAGNGLNIAVDMGTIDGIGYSMALYSEILEMGDNCKVNVKGSKFANASIGESKVSMGITSRVATVGNTSTIEVGLEGNCNHGFVFEKIVLGKDSVIKAYGKEYAVLGASATKPDCLAYGGAKVNDTAKLEYKEIEYMGTKSYSYLNGTTPAKYVELGNLLTINLKCTNGTVNKTSFTMHNGHAVGTLPTPVSSRKDYTFAGWYTAATGGSKVYSTTKLTKSTTLYAQWKKITYTINFDANGGTVGVEKKWVEYGNPMEFMPTPKREGYTFTGWYTAATGGTKVYSTTKPTKSMTLYAQWKKITYTINFNANGGTVGVEKKWVDYGNPINFMPTPKREGYTFTGWYTAATGGTKVYSTTKPTKNMTLYAQWKKNTCTITFNANGGKVSTTSKTVNGGTAIGTMPTPTRSGYTFTGWFTAKTGGSKVYTTTKATANMTLYAQWKK